MCNRFATSFFGRLAKGGSAEPTLLRFAFLRALRFCSSLGAVARAPSSAVRPDRKAGTMVAVA
jgi:hypothetical protein